MVAGCALSKMPEALLMAALLPGWRQMYLLLKQCQPGSVKLWHGLGEFQIAGCRLQK
jgi:hypothetical protein